MCSLARKRFTHAQKVKSQSRVSAVRSMAIGWEAKMQNGIQKFTSKETHFADNRTRNVFEANGCQAPSQQKLIFNSATVATMESVCVLHARAEHTFCDCKQLSTMARCTAIASINRQHVADQPPPPPASRPPMRDTPCDEQIYSNVFTRIDEKNTIWRQAIGVYDCMCTLLTLTPHHSLRNAFFFFPDFDFCLFFSFLFVSLNDDLCVYAEMLFSAPHTETESNAKIKSSLVTARTATMLDSSRNFVGAAVGGRAEIAIACVEISINYPKRHQNDIRARLHKHIKIERRTHLVRSYLTDAG